MKSILKPIVETIIRLTSKSPKYFVALQILLLIVGGILSLLGFTDTQTIFSLELPQWLKTAAGPEGIITVVFSLFISLLPSEKPQEVKEKVDSITENK